MDNNIIIYIFMVVSLAIIIFQGVIVWMIKPGKKSQHTIDELFQGLMTVNGNQDHLDEHQHDIVQQLSVLIALLKESRILQPVVSGNGNGHSEEVKNDLVAAFTYVPEPNLEPPQVIEEKPKELTPGEQFKQRSERIKAGIKAKKEEKKNGK
jgi:hypothetical protein